MSVTESIIVAKFTANKAAEFHSCSLRGFALQRTAAAHGVPLTPSQALSVKAAMEQTEPFPTHMRARNNINYWLQCSGKYSPIISVERTTDNPPHIYVNENKIWWNIISMCIRIYRPKKYSTWIFLLITITFLSYRDSPFWSSFACYPTAVVYFALRDSDG